MFVVAGCSCSAKIRLEAVGCDSVMIEVEQEKEIEECLLARERQQ